MAFIDEIKASINDLKKHQEENKKPDEDKVEVQKQSEEDNENKSDGDTLDKIKKLEATIEQMKEKMEANKNIPTPKSYISLMLATIFPISIFKSISSPDFTSNTQPCTKG